ncbi:MAG: isoprenylcysteine carboxylmethyltransferase family protein [Anaerolineae bacterium]|jgi:protein-S-isoprenylcysteine O-methyltransferase Ste14|nr:isoprenylcysteine carboxylmethyltransferase family protein [Anaerolineae bacterium]
MQRKTDWGNGIGLTLAFIGQLVCAIVFYDPAASSTRINIGWGVMWISAIFGWLPILTFRRKGEVQGRSYIHTTVLVDSGIYAIVRHPQYLAGILLNIALFLITMHWTVLVLGGIGAVITYLGTFAEEKETLEKFGEAYREYQKKVPRLNFILGILRLVFGDQ